MTNYDILQEYEAHKTPVPSYKEYNRLKEVERKKGKLVNVNYKIKQENKQLKELLKECVEVLNDAQRNYGYDDSIIDICSPIITKIDNVIGEKK